MKKNDYILIAIIAIVLLMSGVVAAKGMSPSVKGGSGDVYEEVTVSESGWSCWNAFTNNCDEGACSGAGSKCSNGGTCIQRACPASAE